MCRNLRDDEGHFSRSVRIFRTPPLGVESLVVMPIHLDDFWPYTSHLRARVQNNQQQQVRTGLRFRFTSDFSVESMCGAEDAGTAKRRRERRLRQFLRHGPLTVAMALAACTHHAAPRGQSRGAGGGNEMYYTAKFRNIPPQAAGTEYFSLDVEDVPAAGSRPDRFAGVRRFSSTLWTRSSTPRLRCRFSMSLCR